MRKILLGAVLTLALMLLSAFVVTRLGLMPVSGDGTHSRLEARIMSMVLHASIVRHAPGETNPVPLNEDNLKAGADTYKAMCARCLLNRTGQPAEQGSALSRTTLAPALSQETRTTATRCGRPTGGA